MTTTGTLDALDPDELAELIAHLEAVLARRYAHRPPPRPIVTVPTGGLL